MIVENDSTASSVAITLDMFRLARRFQPEKAWHISLYSKLGGNIKLSDVLSVQTRRLPSTLGQFNSIILPGFFAETFDRLVEQLHSPWSTAIQRLQKLPPSTLIAASCYSTFVLAETGLLNGLSATTTWWLADAFLERYPSIALDADKTLIDSGRTITAGAMTAHTDLSLHLLRRLGGTALARRVAGIMLVDGARISQRPFMFMQHNHSDPIICRALTWMTNNIAKPTSVQNLSDTLHVSYRTLNRRFSEVTGMTPLAYMQALKIEHVKALLESTNHDFENITACVGYEDVSSFRRLFKRSTGLSPTQYRRQFKRGSMIKRSGRTR